MARPRAMRERRQLPTSIVVILASGHDFFNDLSGGVTANLDLLRASWQDLAVRRQVYERRRPHRAEPWAALTFGTYDHAASAAARAS